MIFKSKKFSSGKNISHGFCSRKNGYSNGIYNSLNCGLGSKDLKKNVYKNLNYVKKKISSKYLCLVSQKHSNKIIWLKKFSQIQKKIRIGDADGIFTNLNNVAIGILTADCAPILFVDQNNNYICCVHAGWKGAFSNIIQKAVALFRKNKILPKNIRVCIGPCISQDSYEVKADFYNKFILSNTNFKKCFLFKNNKIYFNLRYFIKLKLVNAKISMSNIFDINKDTFVNKSLFYSYRRSLLNGEKDYGRNLSFISKYH